MTTNENKNIYCGKTNSSTTDVCNHHVIFIDGEYGRNVKIFNFFQPVFIYQSWINARVTQLSERNFCN